jgi:hypothetical protein
MLEPIYVNLEPKLAEQLEQKQTENLLLKLESGLQGSLFEIYPIEFPVRWVWCSEASDFTNWLKNNIKCLQPFISHPICNTVSQVKVENFRIDLVTYGCNCKFKSVEPWLEKTNLVTCSHDCKFTPIELQLEKSDHKHLGQIIAYLALQKAQSAIWIATEFAQGHKEVIKILNQSNFAAFHLLTVHVLLRQPNCCYEIMLKPIQI